VTDGRSRFGPQLRVRGVSLNDVDVCHLKCSKYFPCISMVILGNLFAFSKIYNIDVMNIEMCAYMRTYN